jgi:hypothetical protein
MLNILILAINIIILYVLNYYFNIRLRTNGLILFSLHVDIKPRALPGLEYVNVGAFVVTNSCVCGVFWE